MRLRRIIAAFLREQANDARKRKIQEKEQKKEQTRKSRARERETRQAQRQRAKQQEASNRWSKKHKADFLRTILSFGVETHPDEPEIQWTRFKEIAGLEKKTDESLDLYYNKFVVSCEEIMKLHQQEQAEQAANAQANASTNQEGSNETSPASSQVPTGQGQEGESRDSSTEPQAAQASQEDLDTDLVPYDKARRALKRIEQMKTIREQVMVHPELDKLLLNARKTSGLPS